MKQIGQRTHPRRRPRQMAWPIGGGEAGARIRARDWSASALGPIATWPQSLKTALEVCLGSALPMSVSWGEDLIHFYNDPASALMGDRHPGAFGSPLREAWADVWPAITGAVEGVLSDGEPALVADLPVAPRGGAQPEAVCVTFSALRAERGRIAGLLASGFETTAKVRAEAAPCASIERARAAEAQPRSEEKYRTLFDAIDEGITLVELIFDADGRAVDYWVREANPAQEKLNGLHGIVGKRGRESAPDLDGSRIATYAEVARTGIPVRFEERSGQSGRWFDTYVARVGGEGGGPIALVSNDITERKRMEQRTRQALQTLLAMAQALVEHPAADERDGAAAEPAVALSAVCDLAGRLAEMARAVLSCRRVSIVQVDETTGAQTPLALVGATPEEEKYWRTEEARRRFGGGSEPVERARFRSGEVTIVDVDRLARAEQPNPYGIRSLAAVPMVVGGRLFGTLAYDYGATEHTYSDDELALAGAVGRLAALAVERERLLREREEARGRALAWREANRRMQEFLGIAAHELKTPLTALRANADTLGRRLRLAEGQGGAETHALVERLRPMVELTDRGTRRLTRLVDDLIDTTRIHEDRLELRLEPGDLAAVVAEAVREQRELNVARVVRYVSPPMPVPVVADPERIGQVVTNYVSNALKYSGEDRPVEVRLEPRDGEVRVAVRDEGPGVPAEERGRIWEPFYRVAEVGPRSGSGVGLGLGLHISRTIVERHGGRVGVESVVGAGATFWFTLPLAAESDGR